MRWMVNLTTRNYSLILLDTKLNSRPRKTLGYLTPLEIEALKSQVLQ
jgi:IS30 family transposase